MICYNKTLGVEVASNVKKAKGFFGRLKGLLGRKNMSESEGLLLKPCGQVHTFFMRFEIDVVFLNKKNKALGVVNLKPNKLSPWFWKAAGVLELKGGVGIKTVNKGDILEFKS